MLSLSIVIPCGLMTYQGVWQLWVSVMYLPPISYIIRRASKLLSIAWPPSMPIREAIFPSLCASFIPRAVVTKAKSSGYFSTIRRMTSICSMNKRTEFLYWLRQETYADQNYRKTNNGWVKWFSFKIQGKFRIRPKCFMILFLLGLVNGMLVHHGFIKQQH